MNANPTTNHTLRVGCTLGTAASPQSKKIHIKKEAEWGGKCEHFPEMLGRHIPAFSEPLFFCFNLQLQIFFRPGGHTWPDLFSSSFMSHFQPQARVVISLLNSRGDSKPPEGSQVCRATRFPFYVQKADLCHVPPAPPPLINKKMGSHTGRVTIGFETVPRPLC